MQLIDTYNPECIIDDNVNNDMCSTITRRRWDHANLSAYYSKMGVGLQCILTDIVSYEESSCLNISPEGAVEYIFDDEFYEQNLQRYYKCAVQLCE